MEELWLQLYPHLLDAVLTLAVAAIGTISTWAINTLRKKFETEAVTNRKQATLYAIDTVETAASIVVRELEQTVVPEVKKALADGRLTEEEAKKIKAIAAERVRKHINLDLKAAGLNEDLVESVIEAAVLSLKESKK